MPSVPRGLLVPAVTAPGGGAGERLSAMAWPPALPSRRRGLRRGLSWWGSRPMVSAARFSFSCARVTAPDRTTDAHGWASAAASAIASSVTPCAAASAVSVRLVAGARLGQPPVRDRLLDQDRPPGRGGFGRGGARWMARGGSMSPAPR